MLKLKKVSEQTSLYREIYEDEKGNLYCRHIKDFYKGGRVNRWSTFYIEPDCPLKNETEIEIEGNSFIVLRDKYSDWAIEYKKTVVGGYIQTN